MKILSKRIKQNFIIIFPLIILIFGICLNTYVKQNTNKIEYYILTENDVDIYHNGKKDYTGQMNEYKLTNFKNEDTYVMHMKIPKNNIKNPVLFYDNVNTGVNIYVDDEKVYSLGMNTPKGSTISHANIKVPLHNLEGKKEIIMEIRALSNTTFRGMPICTLLNAKDADFYYIFTSMSHQFLANVSFMLFLLGLFIVIFCGLKETILKKILILSLICLSLFIQIISAYKIIQLISDNLVIDVYLEYFTRFSTVGLIALYLYFDDKKEHKLRHLILSNVVFIHGIIATVLQILKIQYLNDSLNIYIIEVCILFIDLVATLYKNLKKKKDKKVIYTMLIILAIFAICALLTIYSFSKYLVLIFDLLPFFMLMIVVIFYIDMIYRLYESFLQTAEKKALSRLAYIDTLTGLPNRRELDNYINIIKTYSDKFRVYSFDLNSLKYINDHYGHHAGDNVIKTFATCLSTTFFDGFCCRLGGDEFLTIIEDSDINENLIDKLTNSLIAIKEKDSLEYDIKFSVGSKSFVGNSEYNFKDILKEADDNMYKMKQANKKMSTH